MGVFELLLNDVYTIERKTRTSDGNVEWPEGWSELTTVPIPEATLDDADIDTAVAATWDAYAGVV